MPKILWLSPYSLHDLSSGASIHCKTILEGLAKRNFEVWACSSFIFNAPNGAKQFNNLAAKLARNKQNIFEFNDNGIHYVYTRCKSTAEEQSTLAEQELYFQAVGKVLDTFRPDIVMGFGTSMVSMTCFAEAKRRGMTTVYPVLNGNHGHYTFPDVDLVITDSRATEQLYRRRDNIRMIPTGAIFDASSFVAKNREPKYVTFINPAFEKGLAVFAKLVKVCEQELPDQRFLVVNLNGNFAENVQYLHVKGEKKNHPFTPKDFASVDMTPSTQNMKSIYRETKVLLAPSLWWESWGRVATEAVFNNIPVLASNSGGLPEAIAGAGITIAPPAHSVQDFLSIPDDDEIKPWVEALKRLLTEDWTAACTKAQATLNIDQGIDNVVKILLPYITHCERERIGFNLS
ncbi:MAG: glycosyltransferase [Candidatus Anaerobiospirillum pullicola]|uniref:Glycosyltransferase n=1 Tax=Candidatus Anaerobiospirillum pullicola TaxID=2838451 RepID=A0A948THJ7_9GAMM|nr:glycosyltransferase [Candidatus Anaerobiospirillum pullicola]